MRAWRLVWLVLLCSAMSVGVGCGSDKGGTTVIDAGGDGDGDGDVEDCMPGTERCRCTVMGRCGEGLTCASGLCVYVGGDGDGDGDGDSGDGDGDGDAVGDAGVDAGNGLGPLPPYDPGPIPDGWDCPDHLWGDNYCDCGCGVEDADCTHFVGFSCTEPGCVLDECHACFDAEGAVMTQVQDGYRMLLANFVCSEELAEAEWQCDPLRRNDTVCDCGCGIPDPKCGDGGCTGSGCWAPNCTRMHESDENSFTEIPATRPSTNWKCAPKKYGDGNCDCGCGEADPDCGGGGCAQGNCNDAVCDTCHDHSGSALRRCLPGLHLWNPECSADAYDKRDGICDCGCDAIDPDCGVGRGCATPGCSDPQCDTCTGPSYEPAGCDMPVEFTCGALHYGTGDGCDCGCGAPDPDCDPGCSGDACQDDSCDFCHGGGLPIQCDGWTCPADRFAEGGTASCDCGCGSGDPDCRPGGNARAFRDFCTEAGCEVGTCQFCTAEDGGRSACGGILSAAVSKRLTHNGLCDCGPGVGGTDPECNFGLGCGASASCNIPGCQQCWETASKQMNCGHWRCEPLTYGDGTCDCGCGIQDTDCDTASRQYTTPGGRVVTPNEPQCEVCHDAYGRVVPCP